jgi:hypothetical protein
MELKTWLKKNGYTYTQFAIYLGITNFHLGRIIAGKKIPGRELAKKIEYITDGAVEARDLLQL